jgi:hypothetical protein
MNNQLKQAAEDYERLQHKLILPLSDARQLATVLENILSYETPATEAEIATANGMHGRVANLETQLRYFLEKR